MARGLKGVPLLGGVADAANRYDRKSNYRDAPPELRKQMGLKNSYELEGDLVSEEDYDRDRDEDQEAYGVQGGRRTSSRNPRSAGKVERSKRARRRSIENDPRYGSVADDRSDEERKDERDFWSRMQGGGR